MINLHMSTIVCVMVFFCETHLQTQTLTYTSAHSPLWTHARISYPYEHLRRTKLDRQSIVFFSHQLWDFCSYRHVLLNLLQALRYSQTQYPHKTEPSGFLAHCMYDKGNTRSLWLVAVSIQVWSISSSRTRGRRSVLTAIALTNNALPTQTHTVLFHNGSKLSYMSQKSQIVADPRYLIHPLSPVHDDDNRLAYTGRKINEAIWKKKKE